MLRYALTGYIKKHWLGLINTTLYLVAFSVITFSTTRVIILGSVLFAITMLNYLRGLQEI